MTEVPFRLMLVRLPEGKLIGSIAWRFLPPAATEILKLRVPLFHVSDPKEELLRPSNQVNICWADTTGTPRACAEAMMASAPSDCTESWCIFAVNAP